MIEMETFNCTPRKHYVVYPSYPYLETTVDNFDLDIMANQDIVRCLYGNRVFECIVSSVETDMCSGKSDLEFIVIRELTNKNEMKQQDFDRLKAICEKEGYGIQNFHSDETYHIWKKDIWEGVEFFEASGKIHPLLRIEVAPYRTVVISKRIGNTTERQWLINYCKPSTESAYIEELKKEAFERFGEIKDGDRFDISIIRSGASNDWKVQDPKKGFYYEKDIDGLMFGGIFIYQAGKWATKLPKRVEVKLISDGWKNNRFDGYDFCFDFCVKNGGHNKEVGQIGQFLASQLEKYLNGEVD